MYGKYSGFMQIIINDYFYVYILLASYINNLIIVLI